MLPSVMGLYFTTVLMSVGFHYFFTLQKSLALQWISSEHTPVTLGRLSAARSYAAVLVFAGIWLGLEIWQLDYRWLYLLAGVATVLVVLWGWLAFPRFSHQVPQHKHLLMRRRYWLYYALTFMGGARRQIFVVFADPEADRDGTVCYGFAMRILWGSPLPPIHSGVSDYAVELLAELGTDDKVAEAREIVEAQESEKLIDQRQVADDARRRVEQGGLIFLDEIDKVAGREGGRGPDVSREGVQRDLLPIVEGTTVTTKYGMVKTDHILFIAAGAFHVAKPSDLIPELQGRFPIRVELKSLTTEDFVRILTEPDASLTLQYKALLATEEVGVEFSESGVRRLAEVAYQVNENTENIGARRLHTVMERLLDVISYDAPARSGESFEIDGAYVDAHLDELAGNEDLSRYIL